MFSSRGSEAFIPSRDREEEAVKYKAGHHTGNARAVLLALLLAVMAAAQTSNRTPPQLRNVKFDQKLNSQLPLDLPFRDETGRTVELRRYFGSRPVVLALIYYSCPRLCPMSLSGLVKALRAISLDSGKDFDVLAVSFDSRETPELAAAAKEHNVAAYGRPGAAQGWHFLTGEKNEIIRLAHAVGFGFDYDAKNDTFSHPSGVIVVTPAGRVAKYFFGIEYSARDLRLGLVDAAARRIGTPVDQILLYCFHYDPETGQYTLSILRTIRAFGMATVAGIFAFVAISIRRERRRRKGGARP
ncbi:MAG: SCO family protein [Acidobacteria bacterium]|nr:SCO family protein [Acidobacteriota bacterium]MBI3280063.1 SCO family protein [Acidobacteriota bacterium]